MGSCYLREVHVSLVLLLLGKGFGKGRTPNVRRRRRREVRLGWFTRRWEGYRGRRSIRCQCRRVATGEARIILKQSLKLSKLPLMSNFNPEKLKGMSIE